MIVGMAIDLEYGHTKPAVDDVRAQHGDCAAQCANALARGVADADMAMDERCINHGEQAEVVGDAAPDGVVEQRNGRNCREGTLR